jgi:fibronectin-binding autotransporter adhesin
MAQNYTRQSSFADGDTITAALFNNEFNQVVNAFSYSASSDSSTGHKHDGTAGQGGNIPQIGDIDFLNKIVVDNTNNRWGFYVQVSSGTVEQLRIQDGAIVPVTDDDIDLGTSSLEFKDLFIDGTAHIDTLDVDVNATVAGTLGVTGATTLSSTLGVTGATTLSSTLGVTGAITGSSTLQATTITATTAFVPDASDGASLGTSALEFSDLFLADGAVINFGTDQDVSLTHVADTGLLLNSTMALQFNDASQYINAPSATVLDINATDEIELNATLVDVNANLDVSGTVTATGTSVFASLDISGDIDVDGTTNLDVVDIDGAVNIAAATTIATDNKIQFRDTAIYVNSSTDGQLDIVADTEVQIAATTVDINGAVDISGNLDVGGNLVVTGTTTFNGGTLTMGDAATDNVVFGADINSNIIPNTDDTYDLGSSSQEWRNLYIDGTANIDSLVADTADINGGTIDGATIATSDITVGSGKTLNVSAGTLTLADDQISGDKVEGGTIAATTITTLTSTTGNITSVNATTVDTTNLEVTTLKAKDGTAAGSIADSTGVVTLASSVLTTTDINGGTVDGVTIGGSSAGNITYANLSDGTITITAFVDEDDMSSDSATLVPTQQSVKAYVDSQVGTVDTLSEILANGNTTGSTDIAVDSAQKVQFRDAAIYLNSSVDGQLDIVADTEIQIAATTVDLNGNLDVSGTTLVTGVLTTTAATVFNGGFASNADSTLGTDKKVQFRDSAIYINSSADGQLDIVADTEIQIAATTVDLNGNLDVSGTALVAGVLTTTAATVFNGGFASNADSTLGTDKKVQFRDAAIYINSSVDGQLDIVADTEIQIAATTVDLNGNLDVSGTTVSAGKITADAGIDIDNINIDGTTIALSSGDLTLDVAGDINLDADGADINLKDGGTRFGILYNSASNFHIEASVQDKDIKFLGNDEGVGITALTLDMSDAGNATFNNHVNVGDGKAFITGASSDFQMYHSSGANVLHTIVSDADMTFKGNDGGSTITALTLDMSDAGTASFNHDIKVGSGGIVMSDTFNNQANNANVIYRSGSTTVVGNNATALVVADSGTTSFGGVVTANAGVVVDNFTLDGTTLALSSGHFTLDVAGDINLDSDSGYVLFKDAGVEHARIFQNNSGDVNISSQISDKDMKFLGNDGGVGITALTLDMSNAGAATFNANITAAAAAINGQLNVTGTTNSNNIYAQQLSTQFDLSSFMRFHPTSVTDSGGFTNIFFGTSTDNNYGVAVGGERSGTDNTPSFAVRTLNDSITGIKVLNITNAGEVTKPYQPAFYATPSSTQTNVAANDSAVTVAMGTEIFDVGSNFASNTFTAPVTGKYQLNLSLYLLNVDTAATYVLVGIVTSNRNYINIVSPKYASDLSYLTQNISTLADMDAGDTAYVFYQQSGGAAQIDIDNDTRASFFQGYLVA